MLLTESEFPTFVMENGMNRTGTAFLQRRPVFLQLIDNVGVCSLLILGSPSKVVHF